MPKCTANQLRFGRLGRRVTTAKFNGGALSSDRGVALLRQFDQRIGLPTCIAAALHAPRDPQRNAHSMRTPIAQRL